MQKTSSRLLALLSLLQTHRDWSGDDLAERLSVTARTVRRDIDRLRELGYPIHTAKGPAGGYRLSAGTRLPPLLFDDGQAVALALALHTAAADPAIGEDATRALATLRQVMPPRLRHRIDALQVTAVRPAGTHTRATAEPHLLLALSEIIRAREELRFDYRSPAGAGTHGTDGDGTQRRRAQPHHLLTWRGHWYLLAWDPDRGDWRTFRADRISAIRTPNGPRFTPRPLPGDDASAFLTGRFRGTDGTTTDWPCLGEAVLHLPAHAVAPFAPDAVVEALGPHRCRLVLGSWSWTGLAAALGRFDTEIDHVGPPQLTAAFARLADRCGRAARAATGSA
ncbi:WYL domain-containing protein [Streptomyces sp. NPDC021356]|uniref:helix-turn-helix transcriptional regulator n=1 Tax=Streptomyces sp. NPDC021356 TaxID=3154900 RepID=UPI0033D5B6E9